MQEVSNYNTISVLFNAIVSDLSITLLSVAGITKLPRKYQIILPMQTNLERIYVMMVFHSEVKSFYFYIFLKIDLTLNFDKSAV